MALADGWACRRMQVLRLTGNLWRFASGTHMVVEASVLENLEASTCSPLPSLELR